MVPGEVWAFDELEWFGLLKIRSGVGMLGTTKVGLLTVDETVEWLGRR